MSSLLRRFRRRVRVDFAAGRARATGAAAARAAGAARPSEATSSWSDAPRMASTVALAKVAERESSCERRVGMGPGAYHAMGGLVMKIARREVALAYSLSSSESPKYRCARRSGAPTPAIAWPLRRRARL